MMNSVILLSHSNSTRNATRKIFETLYIDPPFLVRNLPEAPAEIDVNEFIVSEAMKLACNDDERVLILDIDKKDVIEKDILCDKFDSLVRFLPHPFLLPDVVSMLTDLKKENILKCEESCTADIHESKKISNIYAGKVLFVICHELRKKNKESFRKILGQIGLIRKLFVPKHGEELSQVKLFLDKMEHLEKVSDSSQKEFENEAEATIKMFPYFPNLRKVPKI